MINGVFSKTLFCFIDIPIRPVDLFLLIHALDY